MLPFYLCANDRLPVPCVNRKVLVGGGGGEGTCACNSLPLCPHSAGRVYLTEVRLTSAQRGLSPPASWVETCSCPTGYAGQFCESCAPGYKRETPLGGPYTSCVPCTCNQHGTCDPHTGESCPPPPSKPPGPHPAQQVSADPNRVSRGQCEWSLRAVLLRWCPRGPPRAGHLSTRCVIDSCKRRS